MAYSTVQYAEKTNKFLEKVKLWEVVEVYQFSPSHTILHHQNMIAFVNHTENAEQSFKYLEDIYDRRLIPSVANILRSYKFVEMRMIISKSKLIYLFSNPIFSLFLVIFCNS